MVGQMGIGIYHVFTKKAQYDSYNQNWQSYVLKDQRKKRRKTVEYKRKNNKRVP